MLPPKESYHVHFLPLARHVLAALIIWMKITFQQHSKCVFSKNVKSLATRNHARENPGLIKHSATSTANLGSVSSLMLELLTQGQKFHISVKGHFHPELGIATLVDMSGSLRLRA